MKTVIHVNQFNIRANRKNGTNLPVITVKTYKSNTYGKTVKIKSNGKEIARVVYRPEKPLKCGAVCWVETIGEVEVK